VFEILFLLGGVLLLGFAGNKLFQRTLIPEPVILILAGFLFGEIGIYWLAPQGVTATTILSFAPLLAALAVVFFLFDAGMSFDVPEVFRKITFSTAFSLACILATGVLTAAALFYGLRLSLESSLLIAALVSGSSALSVNAMLDLFPASKATRNTLKTEGILAAMLMPLAFVAVLRHFGLSAASEQPWQAVFYSLAFSVVFGAVVGLVWASALRRFKVKNYSYVATMALMLVLFFVDYKITGVGMIAVLFAGIAVGNYGRVAKLVDGKGDYELGEEFLAPARELIMLVKTVFLAYVGLSLSALKPPFDSLIVGVLLVACILLARFAVVNAAAAFKKRDVGKEGLILAAVAPRGILNATIALFALIPAFGAPPDFDISAVLIAVLLSMLASAAAAHTYEKAYRKTLLFRAEVALKNGKTAVVRAANFDDIPALKKFINELVAEGALIVFDRRLKNEGDFEVLRSDIEKSNRGESVFWIAELDGAVIARAKAQKMELRERDNVELSIYVAKNFRRLGLGKKMLKMIIGKAKEDLQPKNVFLSVYTKNAPAIKLYKTLGFEVAGKLPEWGRFGNEFFDEYFMVYKPKK